MKNFKFRIITKGKNKNKIPVFVVDPLAKVDRSKLETEPFGIVLSRDPTPGAHWDSCG